MSVFERLRLDGKKLFNTGGSRGLGREMALAIAEAGADVVLAGRSEESLQATTEEIKQLGRAAFPITADIGNPEQCQEACQRVVTEFGPIDILINNVGGRRENILTEEMSLEKWRELMDLNLTSAFLCTRIVGATMIERGEGGKIVFISSVQAEMPIARCVAYGAAKAGLNHMMRTIAVELSWAMISAERGCPVNSPISPTGMPGLMRTSSSPDAPMTRNCPFSRINISSLGSPNT